jgi:fucose permease
MTLPTSEKTTGPLPLLFVAFYAFIVIGMPFGVLNIAWTYMQNSFDVPLDALGILLTTFTAGHLTSAFLSGRVIARTGIRHFLLGGSLLFGLGTLGYILAPSWLVLLAVAVVFGMGTGSIDAGVNTFVSSRYKASHLNWVHACYGLGLTIGPPTVTFFVQLLDQSWRWSYGLVLVLSGILSLLIALYRRGWEPIAEQDNPPTADNTVPEYVSSASARETLTSPIVLLGMLLFFIYSGAELSAGQLSNTLLTDSRGVEPEVASFWISMYWASFTISRLLIGFLTERFSTRALMRSCMLASLFGATALWINLSSAVSLIGLIILGFALAPMFATLIAETPQRVGLRHAANAIGFQIASAGLGAALIPGLGSVLASRVGLESIGPFLAATTLAVLILYEGLLRQNARAALRITTAPADDVHPA